MHRAMISANMYFPQVSINKLRDCK